MSDRQEAIPFGGGFAHIDCFGEGVIAIESRGKTYWFEHSALFGPLPTNTRGDPIKTDWPMHVYRAASLWRLQGRRMDGDVAVWHEPRQPVYEKRGRHSFVLQYGEPGWDW